MFGFAMSLGYLVSCLQLHKLCQLWFPAYAVDLKSNQPLVGYSHKL